MAELRVKGTGTLKLFENDNTSSVTIASPASLGADRTITLPDGDVTLSTGTMPVLTGSTNNTVTTVTGADAIQGEAKLTFDGSTLINVQDAGAASEIRASAATVYTKVIADDASGFSAIDYSHDLRFKDAGTETMRISSLGHVQMHMETYGSAPSASNGGAMFEANGVSVVWQNSQGSGTSSCNHAEFMNGNGTVGTINTNGTATAYNTSSDYRLKENETSITDGIDRIKQLKPYRFNFKADADKTVDGFFAHEVSNIVPEAITGEKDAMHPEVLYVEGDELPEGKEIGDVKEETKINPQGIDQAKLVPLLTSALQEAITKIETLEAKVTALENA